MATIISSALTFLDTTDHNQLSAYLTSNFAVVQTCTSDKTVYSPDWSLNHLVLQLHAIYDGENMNSNELDGKVKWFYKEGNEVNKTQINNDNAYEITSYGTELHVKDNVLSTFSSDSVTFICEIQLDEEGIDIATVQMTYTLISDTKAVSFYVGTPGGNMFHNQEGTLEVIAYAHYGTEVIEAGTDEDAGKINSEKAKFKWEKYTTGGAWEVVTDSNEDPTQLTIKGEDVLNVATFKCTMRYKDVEYIGVATVQDITDTYISEILTVGGNVFKNGTGGSAAYVVVRINGQDKEVDPLKGDIGVNAPSSPKSGDLWYQIDKEKGQIVHQKYNGFDWVSQIIEHEFDYMWTLRDQDGVEKPFSNRAYAQKGKVIYVSCADIDSTGTVQCTVFKK